MKILVTGAEGFVGKNLCAALRNIQEGKDRTHPWLEIEAVYRYDLGGTAAELEEYCGACDFVFNLAGVNRPKEQTEYMEGNFGFATALLETLGRCGNRCPVMLSSSQQASLAGRFGDSEYGRSKRAGEELFLGYGVRTGARVLVYRFPNLFGKWCRPNYNSAVATFCHNIARGLPVTVSDPSVELELLYIDDLVEEMLLALVGREHRCEYRGLEAVPDAAGRYCHVPGTHRATLGRIVELLRAYAAQPETLDIPPMPAGSFEKKLYATYLSHLPAGRVSTALRTNADGRGSFTELLHLADCGQVSVNVSRPGVTKGQHWHHTKWEQFIVVKGRGLIRQRSLDDPEGRVLEWEVSGDRLEAVRMLPGYTHSIVNLSDSEDLVTVMYSNETFDPGHPDTYYEPV